MSLSCDFDFIYVQEIHGIYVMLIKAGCSWIFFCAMLTLCETIKFYCTNLKLAKETNFNILQVGERNYSCNIYVIRFLTIIYVYIILTDYERDDNSIFNEKHIIFAIIIKNQ